MRKPFTRNSFWIEGKSYVLQQFLVRIKQLKKCVPVRAGRSEMKCVMWTVFMSRGGSRSRKVRWRRLVWGWSPVHLLTAAVQRLTAEAHSPSRDTNPSVHRVRRVNNVGKCLILWVKNTNNKASDFSPVQCVTDEFCHGYVFFFFFLEFSDVICVCISCLV